MKAPHTKEPWFAVEYAGFINIQDGPYYENRNLLDCSNFKGQDVFDEETVRANGARIVECVNAMAGIETPVEYIKAMRDNHEHHDLLIEILEYMEAREDADIEVENKEMRFAMGLREMLKID